MNLQHQKWAIYMEGALGERNGKMGEGVLRFGAQEIVAVIDSRYSGHRVRDVVPLPSPVPVVADLEDAIALGAQVLLLGTAPSGGRVPVDWEPIIRLALNRGLSLINGMHDWLADRFAPLIQEPGRQVIWDVRRPRGEYPIGTARASKLNNRRVLMVGTDMAIGKMTSGLLVHRWLLDHGANSAFLATGQVGITITGNGIPLDAIKVDQASGAVEAAVLELGHNEIVIVEGQGSLAHPGSTATLPLMRGSCPTHLILCHRACTTTNEIVPEVAIPPLKEFARLNQEVAGILGSLPEPQLLGIALNTSQLDEARAREEIERTQQETGLPTTDVVRFGAGLLAAPLLA